MISLAGATLGAAGISALGSIFANQANAREASRNRDWQERMSNTSYQRKVKDLKQAGLNPMLAVSGPGAQTGPGAQAKHESVTKDTARSITSAISLRKAKAEIKVLEAQERSIDADTNLKTETSRKTFYQTGTEQQRQLQELDKTDLSRKTHLDKLKRDKQSTIEARARAYNMEAKAHSAREINTLKKRQAELDLRLLKIDAAIKRASQVFKRR